MSENEKEEAIRKATEILEEAGFNDFLIGGLGDEIVNMGVKGEGKNIYMIFKALGHQLPEIFTSLMIEELERLNEYLGDENDNANIQNINPQNTIPQ